METQIRYKYLKNNDVNNFHDFMVFLNLMNFSLQRLSYVRAQHYPMVKSEPKQLRRNLVAYKVNKVKCMCTLTEWHLKTKTD